MSSTEVGSTEALASIPVENPVVEGSSPRKTSHKRIILIVVVTLLIVAIGLAIALPLTLKPASSAAANTTPTPTVMPHPRPNLPVFNTNVNDSTYIMSVHTECARPGVIALTFDDGPSQYTAPILDALSKFAYPATFFVVGSAIPGFEASLKRMIPEGHTVASHTFTHANLSSLSVSQIQDEMNKNSAAIKNAIGKDPLFMRPPYLEISDTVKTTLNNMGYIPITINRDTKDYENPAPPAAGVVHPTIQVYNQLASDPNRMTGSDIILMHDIVESTRVQIEQILSIVKSSGLTPVTMEECLGITQVYR